MKISDIQKKIFRDINLIYLLFILSKQNNFQLLEKISPEDIKDSIDYLEKKQKSSLGEYIKQLIHINSINIPLDFFEIIVSYPEPQSSIKLKLLDTRRIEHYKYINNLIKLWSQLFSGNVKWGKDSCGITY